MLGLTGITTHDLYNTIFWTPPSRLTSPHSTTYSSPQPQPNHIPHFFTQVPAPTTTDNVVRRRTRHRRTSTGNKRRRPSPPEPPVVVNNLRADAALERMAAAKEDAARSQWRSQCNHHCVFVSSHQPSSMYRYRRVPAFSAIQRRAENRSTDIALARIGA